MSLNIQHFHDNKEKYIETLDISTEGPCTMVDGKMVCQEMRNDIDKLININNNIVKRRNDELKKQKDILKVNVDKKREVQDKISKEVSDRDEVINELTEQTLLSNNLKSGLYKKYEDNLQQVNKINMNESELLNVTHKIDKDKNNNNRSLFNSETICGGSGSYDVTLQKCICDGNKDSDYFCEECMPGFDLGTDCNQCLPGYIKDTKHITKKIYKEGNELLGITDISDSGNKIYPRMWSDTPVEGRYFRLLITKYVKHPSLRLRVVCEEMINNKPVRKYITNDGTSSRWQNLKGINKSLHWNTDIHKSWFTEPRDNEWCQIDLGKKMKIIGVQIKKGGSKARRDERGSVSEFIPQFSNDGENFKEIQISRSNKYRSYTYNFDYIKVECPGGDVRRRRGRGNWESWNWGGGSPENDMVVKNNMVNTTQDNVETLYVNYPGNFRNGKPVYINCWGHIIYYTDRRIDIQNFKAISKAVKEDEGVWVFSPLFHSYNHRPLVVYGRIVKKDDSITPPIDINPQSWRQLGGAQYRNLEMPDHYFKVTFVKIYEKDSVCIKNTCNVSNTINYDDNFPDDNVDKRFGTCNIQESFKSNIIPLSRLKMWNKWRYSDSTTRIPDRSFNSTREWYLVRDHHARHTAVFNSPNSNIYDEIIEFESKILLDKIVFGKLGAKGDLTEFELYYSEDDNPRNNWKPIIRGFDYYRMNRSLGRNRSVNPPQRETNFQGYQKNIKWIQIKPNASGLFVIRPANNSRYTYQGKIGSEVSLNSSVELPYKIITKYLKIRPKGIGHHPDNRLYYTYLIYGQIYSSVNTTLCANRWSGADCNTCQLEKANKKTCSCYYDVVNGYWELDGDKCKCAGGHIIFNGNKNHGDSVDVLFPKQYKAQYIRLIPETWNKDIAMQWQVLTTDGKMNPGESERLYSSYTQRGKTTYARSQLNNQRSSWQAGINNNKQWTEINLGNVKTITGVTIRGNGDGKWVKTFKISVKNDNGIFTPVSTNDREGYWAGTNCNQCELGWWGSKCRNQAILFTDTSRYTFSIDPQTVPSWRWNRQAAWRDQDNIIPGSKSSKYTYLSISINQPRDWKIHLREGTGFTYDQWLLDYALRYNKTYIQVDLGVQHQILGLLIGGRDNGRDRFNRNIEYFKIFISNDKNFEKFDMVEPYDRVYAPRGWGVDGTQRSLRQWNIIRRHPYGVRYSRPAQSSGRETWPMFSKRFMGSIGAGHSTAWPGAGDINAADTYQNVEVNPKYIFNGPDKSGLPLQKWFKNPVNARYIRLIPVYYTPFHRYNHMKHMGIQFAPYIGGAVFDV